MKQGEWFRQMFGRLKKRKPEKSDYLILVLIGILLLVIVLPVGDKKTDSSKQETKQQEQAVQKKNETVSGEELERRLADILSQIEGAGEVVVMITYKDSGTQVVEKDVASQSSTVEETDGSAEQHTKDTQSQQTTVYDEAENGNTPFISQELAPRIEGILVVASGGDDPVVKQNISEAVLALFPVEAHRIKIAKMNWQEGGQ